MAKVMTWLDSARKKCPSLMEVDSLVLLNLMSWLFLAVNNDEKENAVALAWRIDSFIDGAQWAGRLSEQDVRELGNFFDNLAKGGIQWLES